MDVPNRAEHPSRKQGDHTSLHDGSYKLQMSQSAAGLPTPLGTMGHPSWPKDSEHPGGNTTPKMTMPTNPHASREPASPSRAVGKHGQREFLDLIE
jgi:hypothetical protein